nr:hypothetical protein BaRGS_004141 [Batillaria attramentaria]
MWVVCGLKDIFGEGMTEHLIVIMAGKDNYAKGINKNTSDPEVERLFEEELKRCKHLNNLLDESKRRYMLFDNEAGVDTKKQQVSQLFLMVKEMVVQNGGKYFVHKLAEEINQALNAMVEVKLGENGHYELILTKNSTEEEKPIPPEEGPVAPPDNSSSMKPYDPEASETQETAATSVDELVNPSETTEIAEPEYSEVDKAEVATEVRETREADTTAHATQSHQPDPFAPEEPQQEEPVYSGVKKNEENTTEETYSKEENDEEEDDEEDEDKELSHIEREQRERLRGIEEIRQFGTVRERLKRLSGGEQSPKPEPEAGKTKIWRQSSDQRETTRSITAPSQITSLLSQGKIGQDVIGVTKETESLQISHPHDWFEEEEDLNQLLEKLPGLPGLTLQEQREMIEEALKRKLATLPIENLTKAERERLEASATSIREKFKEGMKKWAVIRDHPYVVYNVLKDVFGERMTSFLIVIMVGADELEKENVSFEAQLEKSERLKTLLAEADNRYLLFNNKAKRKDVQVDRLLSMVKTMVVKNGGRYFRHKLSDQLSISMKVMMKEEIQLRQARQVTSDDTDTAMRIGGSGEGQEAKSATLDTRTVKTHSALYPAEEAGQVQMRGHQRSKSDTNQLDITSDAERPHSPGAAERMQELEELQKAGRVKEHRNRYSVREQEKRKKLAEMTPAPSALIEESLEATETAKEQAPFDEEESEWGGKGTAKASRAEKSTSAGVRQFSEEEERRMQAAIQQYKISRTAKALGPLQVGVPTIFVSHVPDTQPEQTSKGDRAIEDELIEKIVASENDLTDGQREELEKASSSFAQQVGLKISHKKTEVMMLNVQNPSPVRVNGEDLPTTDEFTYFGSIVRHDGGADSDIRNRLNKAKKQLPPC